MNDLELLERSLPPLNVEEEASSSTSTSSTLDDYEEDDAEEEEMPVIGPEDVMSLDCPTEGFLCNVGAIDQYAIEFRSFKIFDPFSNKKYLNVEDENVDFDVTAANGKAVGSVQLDLDLTNPDDLGRSVKYIFDSDILKCSTLQSSVKFALSNNRPIENFRMIEHHYFGDKLIQSYDFDFGFVMPNSVNTWDSIYDVPTLDTSQIQQMMDRPFETTADTFYFINDKLAIHNKSKYEYVNTSSNDSA